MKKVLKLTIVVLILAIISCSCVSTKKTNAKKSSKKKKTTKIEKVVEEDSEDEISNGIDVVPKLDQVHSICQLATLKCYYHNTAIEVKPAGSGVSHWGEDDTEFWFEYSAEATLGIDISQVDMTIEGDKIVVTMPHATILGEISVDSNSITDPIYPPNTFWKNDVEITASDVTDSMANANQKVKEQIMNDKVALSTAESRAQELITNYIKQITVLSGVDYTIEFAFVED